MITGKELVKINLGMEGGPSRSQYIRFSTGGGGGGGSGEGASQD